MQQHLSVKDEPNSVDQKEAVSLPEKFSRRSGGGGLSSSLIFSDLCERHGDRLIAFDLKTGEMLCNRCIYKKEKPNFQFSSTIAKRVEMSHKRKYAELEKAIDELQAVAPARLSLHVKEGIASLLTDI